MSQAQCSGLLTNLLVSIYAFCRTFFAEFAPEGAFLFPARQRARCLAARLWKLAAGLLAGCWLAGGLHKNSRLGCALDPEGCASRGDHPEKAKPAA
ncbi:hypothetical protein [Comamonas composti]|uniref:hypothetical protein n=1 Tax=Comamonas composti TaxID=408558 RepID=UPI001FDEE90A|nr:hypothetical protein [Comamonas composti]